MSAPGVPESAIIIGGSMTGLLQALSLKRQGCNVVVLERDPCDLRAGHESGIQIGPTFIELLNKYDKTGQQITFPIKGVCWAWKNKSGGRKISPGKEEDCKSEKQMANWTALYQLLRANFDGLVSATIPVPPKSDPKTDGHAEYRAGKLVTGIAQKSGKVHITFKDVQTNKTETLVAAVAFAADGMYSTVRGLMKIPTRIEEANYLAWRGSVCEEVIGTAAVDYFERRLNFLFVNDGYFVVYIMPHTTGDLTRGKRLINWVWYCPSSPSDSRTDIFTDINKATHRTTVPPGLLNPKIWTSQLEAHLASMPDELAEVVSNTPRPFVTKVVESSVSCPVPVASSSASEDQKLLDSYQSPYSAFNGQLILIGDALSKFRPHMGMATEQSALHVKQMERLFKGEITMAERDDEARLYAEKNKLLNRAVGFMGLRDWLSLIKTGAGLCWQMFSNWTMNGAFYPAHNMSTSVTSR